jgi:hypothetical protein
MGIGDIARVISSPVQTFSNIEKSKPSFLDGFLFFVFVQTFVLGFFYVFLSVIGENYWVGSLIPILIGVSPLPLLSYPGIGSYLISMALAFVEIIILSLAFHGVSKYVHKGSGSFSTIFTLLSISQIVSIFPILILPFINLSPVASMLMVPLFGYILMTIIWKYLLYGFSIGTTYKISDAKIVVALILSFLVFFMVYPLITAALFTQVSTEIMRMGTFGLPSVQYATATIEKAGESNVLSILK